MQLQPQPCTDRLVPIAQAHQITLQDTVKNTTSIMVLANKEMLIQALSNIIKNAILYNQEKGSVVISTELKHGVVTIIVQDTGVGIAAHDLEHIFERFYRADRSRSRVSGGSGLGLAITKSIIASFGGSIRITSALHKGTTVSITLPLAD